MLPPSLTTTGKSAAQAAAGSRLGIVTPWFGPTLRGGAEQQSFQLAGKLAERGYAVDVLTTCSASFTDDWSKNTFASGIEKLGNLSIHRFKTRKRDRRAFDRVNAILTELAHKSLPRSVSPIGDDDARIFYDENINAPALLSHLSEHGREYRAMIFIPYLYGPTLCGLPLVAERAFLQPCLHDEPYAYLRRVGEIVRDARGLLLNSEGEFELAVRLFGPGIIRKTSIVGEGVITDVACAGQAEHIGTFTPRDHAYLLYLGRQDPSKNIGLLLHAWREFRRRRPTSRLNLVLAGQHGAPGSDRLRGIIDVGAVSTAEKDALLAHCRALVQPSVNESFSRVIYEAWVHARPVIAHADCLATATAVRASDAGLLADTVPSWEAAFESIDAASPARLAQLGERGRGFAREQADWDVVVARYEHALGLETASITSPDAAAPSRTGVGTRERPMAPSVSVDSRVWDVLPDRGLVEALQDGKQNLLYVGKLVTRTHLDHLMVVFLHYLSLEREARLIIVGAGGVDDALYGRLLAEVRRLDLADHVLVARDLSLDQSVAVFRAADLFISLDPEETSGEALLQAMWFDVPILARRTQLAWALAGDAALLLSDTSDPIAIAALAQMLIEDPALRHNVLQAQRKARLRFESEPLAHGVAACSDVPA